LGRGEILEFHPSLIHVLKEMKMKVLSVGKD
jgi:hypothetical protein